MITISTDKLMFLLTEAEQTKLYAAAYKQGQIDMYEIMKPPTANGEEKIG